MSDSNKVLHAAAARLDVGFIAFYRTLGLIAFAVHEIGRAQVLGA
jgi:hypothetical protein